MRVAIRVKIYVIGLLFFLTTLVQCKSRKKRYVNFPEGSTFTMAFCMTIKAITFGDVDIFTEAVAAAVNYDLPQNSTQFPLTIPSVRDSNIPLQQKILQHKYYAARVQRAVIYSKAEKILDAVGIEGRACILRTLCEAVQLLPATGNLIQKLLRIIFTIPIEMMTMEESNQHWQYRAAQISGLQYNECHKLFQRCPISILTLALSLRPQHHNFNHNKN